MFEASVDGQPYDTERWGQYFRPAGVAAPAGSADTAPAAESAPAPVAKAAPAPVSSFDDEDEPAVASAPVEAKPAAASNAQDILAMIRSRQQK